MTSNNQPQPDSPQPPTKYLHPGYPPRQQQYLGPNSGYAGANVAPEDGLAIGAASLQSSNKFQEPKMRICKPPQPTGRQQSEPQKPTFWDGLKSVFSVCQTNASAVESTFDPPLIIVASKPPALFAVPQNLNMV